MVVLANGIQKQARNTILVPDKEDFKPKLEEIKKLNSY
jgi:hypothetical protein